MTRDAEAMLRKLRAHQAELQAMGAEHLAPFGSCATGRQTAESDIDIGVKFDESKTNIGLGHFRACGDLQDRNSDILDAEVHLSDEDQQKPAVHENHLENRVYAFQPSQETFSGHHSKY